jgi:hypothetical protein
MTGRWSPYPYTDNQLATINRLRLAGESWELIAQTIGRSGAGGSIRRYAQLRKLECTILASPPAPPPTLALDPRGRAGPEPLPPMHPISWDAIALHSFQVIGRRLIR